MTLSTTTTDTEFRMGTKALLAAALERTPAGNLTIAAKRARNEIDRRDAKRAAKVSPVIAAKAPAAPAARRTPAQIKAQVAKVRAEAISAAQVATVAKAARKVGLGSRGGDLRKRLASEVARDANGVFSREARDTAYAIALTMTDAEVKSDLRELGFVVA